MNTWTEDYANSMYTAFMLMENKPREYEILKNHWDESVMDNWTEDGPAPTVDDFLVEMNKVIENGPAPTVDDFLVEMNKVIEKWDIPLHPDKVYKKEWEGWDKFLGKDKAK